MANCSLWLSATRMRGFNTTSAYGHAMPSFGLVKVRVNGVYGLQAGPICVFAQGSSVPISRGSPPTSS
jgi:hypothetical protein